MAANMGITWPNCGDLAKQLCVAQAVLGSCRNTPGSHVRPQQQLGYMYFVTVCVFVGMVRVGTSNCKSNPHEARRCGLYRVLHLSPFVTRLLWGKMLRRAVPCCAPHVRDMLATDALPFRRRIFMRRLERHTREDRQRIGNLKDGLWPFHQAPRFRFDHSSPATNMAHNVERGIFGRIRTRDIKTPLALPRNNI